VVLLRLVHPDDIVEQKSVAVARRQAPMRQAWPAHHDGSQLPDFRMDTKVTHHFGSSRE
jgi:hypothetical protein